MPKGLSIKQLLVGLFLALAGLSVSILLLEVGTRFLPLPYDPAIGEFYACHNTLGWTGAPNYSGIVEGPNFRQEVNFNSQGMYDTEHTLEKDPDMFRILVLGDSFIQAVQVNEQETTHQLLEDTLNKLEQGDHLHYEVLSSGVINWGTNQQLTYYREQGHLFQPDLVLLAFYIGNDIQDNLPGNAVTTHGFNCYAPYFTLCDGKINPAPLIYVPGISRLQNNCPSQIKQTAINVLGWLYQHSRLYQQLEPLIIANQPRQQFGRDFPSAFSALYFPNSEAELEQAWQITEATLAQLQQEVEADGANFAVAIISPDIVIRLGTLSSAEQEIFLRDNPAFAQAQANRPNHRLAEFLNRQNIPFIDLTMPMVEHLATNSVPLYIIGEGHWTVEGNRVAAEILAEWLVENKYTP